MRISISTVLLTLLLTLNAGICFSNHALVQWFDEPKAKNFSDLPIGFAAEVQKYVDSHGHVTESLQSALNEIEKRYSHQFSTKARDDFQDILAGIGAKLRGEIRIPRDQTPFWLLEKGSLTNFRSSAKLPKKVDVLIIGAGLTGASSAYHLTEAAQSGKVILVLDEGQVASQSSGKKGGNFQLLPESYVGQYEGIVGERIKWLTKQRPQVPKEDIRRIAEEHARALYNFTNKNTVRFLDILMKEKLECDFSSGGWLKISSTLEEEKSMQIDDKWMRTLNKPEAFESWSPEKIWKNVKIPAKHIARFFPKSGNFHPYKFVTELLKTSIARKVQLYTGVRVDSLLTKNGDEIEVRTSEGIIQAKKVIVATNVFTPRIFPELTSAIEVHVSQIVNLEHVKNHLEGASITEQYGDIYYHFPKSKTYSDTKQKWGMLHYGLDFTDITTAPVQDHFKTILDQIHARFPDTKGQPPSRTWIGPMGFTEDRVPLIGFFQPKNAPANARKNIIVAAAFQGYGGSYCTQAGYVAAQMALTGKVHPDVPEDVFSPQRFLNVNTSSSQAQSRGFLHSPK